MRTKNRKVGGRFITGKARPSKAPAMRPREGKIRLEKYGTTDQARS